MIALPARHLAAQAIDLVYANLAYVSALQILFPPVLLLLFWERVPHLPNLLWCTALVGVYATRIVLTGRYRRAKGGETILPASADPYLWGRRFTLTALASGTLWGLAGILFHVPDAETQRIVLYVLGVGAAAGAIVISSYWMLAYLAYTVPVGVLLAANLALRGDVGERILALIIVLYIAIFVRVAMNIRDQAYAGIELRLENDALIRRLAAEKSAAEDANRAKTQFLAAANHDLRQPVHALSLLLHALRRELSTESGLAIHTRLQRATGNLSSLLGALLDLSRLDAGATKVRITRQSVISLAVRLETEYLPLARDAGIELRVRSCHGVMHTDATLLARLLGNLLTNAIRYTGRGGRVLLAFRRRGERVLVQVWDTGVGIENVDSGDIFREFYQLDNAERERDRENGLGLGLAICRRIADLLDIELGVRSRVGAGTVFDVLLPVGATAIVADSPAVPTPPNLDCLQGRGVLVVDDDPLGLEALAGVLATHGMEVTTADTVERALERTRRLARRPELILSDYRLSGGCDGIALVAALRALPGMAKVPAVLISGDTSPEVLRLMAAAGLPSLGKPLAPEHLLETIAMLLPAAGRKADSDAAQPVADRQEAEGQRLLR